MATEVEQLYLQLELINIEEQMLKLQMLKQATEKTFAGGSSPFTCSAEAERVNLQHWLLRCSYVVRRRNDGEA